jgi:hypothetical protein
MLAPQTTGVPAQSSTSFTTFYCGRPQKSPLRAEFPRSAARPTSQVDCDAPAGRKESKHEAL